jgi:hypothetical protein
MVRTCWFRFRDVRDLFGFGDAPERVVDAPRGAGGDPCSVSTLLPDAPLSIYRAPGQGGRFKYHALFVT